MAIASLVLGIIGVVTFFCYGFGLIPALLAIIFGIMGRKQIARSDEQGRGIATAGLICGSITLGVPLLIFVVLVIFFAVNGH
jgi:hypothetical protein